jgi:hypothetical protein
MAIVIDTNLNTEGKILVAYNPNIRGEMPNASVKSFIPSNITVSLDKWFIGYTPEIIAGYNMIELTDTVGSGLQQFDIIDGTTKKYDANGEINPEEEKEVITLTEEQKVAQVEAKKFLLVAELNRKLDAKLESFFNQFSSAEKATWDLQLSEAKAVTTDETAETPILTVLADQRGITVAELAGKVIEKALDYQATVASIIASKQVIETQVQNAADDAELNTLRDGVVANY